MFAIAPRRRLDSRLLVLVLAGCAWFACATCSVRAQVNVQATIDPLTTRAIMPEGFLGIHTSVYSNTIDHALLPGRLGEAGVQTLRYPGGGYADVFHWSIARASWLNGITGGGLSPWWGEAGNFGWMSWSSHLPNFLNLVDATPGGRATITVNNGSALKLVNGQMAVPDFGGQPQEAAAWFAYVNADPAIYGTPDDVVLGIDQQGNDWRTAGHWARLRASTPQQYQAWATAAGTFDPLNSFLAINRTESYGIEYWEIGNETFGTGYYGGGTGYSVNYDVPYSGNNSHRNGHPDLSPTAYGHDVVNFATLMKAVDPTIKIGAVLNTPPDDNSWGPTWNSDVLAVAGESIDFAAIHWYPWAQNDSAMLAKVRNDLPPMISQLRSSIAASRADGGAEVEIFVTEFETNPGYTPNSPGLNPVFAANAYATWLGLGVSSVQWLELHSSTFLNDAQDRLPVFHAVSLVDKFAKPGDEIVAAASTVANLSVHASRQADGSYGILLVNSSTATNGAANVTVNLGEGRHGGAAQQFLYGLTQVNASTAPVETTLTDLADQFTVTVPRLSVMTLVLAPPSADADFNGDELVDGGDFLIWQRGFGAQGAMLSQGDATGDFQVDAADLAAWLQQFGIVVQASAQGQPIPEPATWLLATVAALSAAARTRASR
ncbi:MAG: hypothetical protein KF688_17380 [Pirellulales bacterium]|nr:hypothetical protein [Pirellulales bacterium]